MATKLRGGGLKALVAGPLRKEPFFAASLNIIYQFHQGIWLDYMNEEQKENTSADLQIFVSSSLPKLNQLLSMFLLFHTLNNTLISGRRLTTTSPSSNWLTTTTTIGQPAD